jgi:hypothetical protein
MNFTIEQLNAVIALAEAEKAKMGQPKVRWLVFDRDGDRAGSSTDGEDEASARRIAANRNKGGTFPPYTVYRCEEVR